MRPDHKEQVIRWAKFAKKNPKKAKAAVKKLIDAQYDISKKFYARLKKTAEGRKIFENLRMHKVNKV